ncbi:MAG TPA: fibronectin type III domain-containing protein [Candidatus Binatia bacterium]
MPRALRRGGRRTLRLVVAACALLGPLGCGRKTDVKPPQLVAPHTVTEVSLTTRPEGIEVGWSRPTEYADGTTMEDLSGFVIERSRNNEAFRELARVPVTDRGRFQKAKRFEYVDKALTEGTTYHYRVVAFTTDGYYGAPSGAATLTWDGPHPASSPGAAVAPTHAHSVKAKAPADLDSGLPAGSAPLH